MIIQYTTQTFTDKRLYSFHLIWIWLFRHADDPLVSWTLYISEPQVFEREHWLSGHYLVNLERNHVEAEAAAASSQRSQRQEPSKKTSCWQRMTSCEPVGWWNIQHRVFLSRTYVIRSQLLDGDLGVHQVFIERDDLSTQRSLLLFVTLSLKHKDTHALIW